jgi:Family of unknown function (DUF6011)
MTTRKQITAKFTGKCSRCGGTVPSGTTCTWAQGEGVRHINCTVTAVAKHNDVEQHILNAEIANVVEAQRNEKSVSVTMGVFKKDGRVYVVKPNKERTRVYAKEIVESPARMTESGMKVDFEARYAPGIVFKLTEADRWDLADAKDFLTKFSKCIVCGRHLKAAKSVERSIGPVCAGYFKSSSHVNACADHDSTAPKGAVAAAESTCTKCNEPFSNCTSDYHCKNNQKMNALRAAPLTADEQELISEIKRMNRDSAAWVAANPGSWASQLVEDIAHWRDYGITSVAAFDEYERAIAEKERRKASYCMQDVDDVVQPTIEQSNAQLLDRRVSGIKASDIDRNFRLSALKLRNS